MTNLCLVGDLAEYLGLRPETESGLLNKLIVRGSEFFLNCVNRDFMYPTLVTETRSGSGKDRIVPSKDPLLKVKGVVVGPMTIPLATDWSKPGYMNDKFTIYLINGYVFSYGIGNVILQYYAGYGTNLIQTTTIGVDGLFTVKNPDWFSFDEGIVDSFGTPFVAVGEDIGVRSGQYTVNDKGDYTFSTDDFGRSVSISFWYAQIPQDVQDAVILICATNYKRRSHIDQDSQVIEGQTVMFSRRDVPGIAQRTIQNYKNHGFMNG